MLQARKRGQYQRINSVLVVPDPPLPCIPAYLPLLPIGYVPAMSMQMDSTLVDMTT